MDKYDQMYLYVLVPVSTMFAAFTGYFLGGVKAVMFEGLTDVAKINSYSLEWTFITAWVVVVIIIAVFIKARSLEK